MGEAEVVGWQYRYLSLYGKVTNGWYHDTPQTFQSILHSWPPGELHETGQEEVQTVDWLGLNQRLGKKDQLAACIPKMSQGANTPQSAQLQDADSKPQEVRSGLVG